MENDRGQMPSDSWMTSLDIWTTPPDTWTWDCTTTMLKTLKKIFLVSIFECFALLELAKKCICLFLKPFEKKVAPFLVILAEENDADQFAST